MKTLTRQQAKDAGLTRYFTGKPCKHGHVAERRIGDGNAMLPNFAQHQYGQIRKRSLTSTSQRMDSECTLVTHTMLIISFHCNTSEYADYTSSIIFK